MSKSRISVGIIIGLIALGANFLGGFFWVALILSIMLIGHHELRTLMAGVQLKPSQTIVNYSLVLTIVTATLNYTTGLSAVLHLSIIASFFKLLFRKPRAHIADIGATLLVVLYIVYLPAHFILLRQLGGVAGMPWFEQPGMYYVLFTIFVISASDVGAYYIGKAFGKTPFYPEISPKKTKEGAIGGLLSGIAVGVLFTQLSATHLTPFHGIVLSILIIVVGQLGDLTESLMKRDGGLKDSGSVLAGHGGILDRIDSYIFSGVVCYYYVYWFIMHQGLAREILNFFS
ncbi:MAG: phosphatidate cytidylyltransferase [Cyanobacteria bacterium P01_H01_bin.74]